MLKDNLVSGIQTPEEREIKHEVNDVWDAFNKEFSFYRKVLVGKVLTIIDAVIIDEKQNKNVKDLIQTAIYGDEKTVDNMADWLIWLYDNLGEDGTSKPIGYPEPKSCNLGNFRPLYRANNKIIN